MITEYEILRFLEGKASEKESQQLNEWLEKSEANRNQFERISAILNASNSLNEYKSVDADIEWDAFNKIISTQEQKVKEESPLVVANKKSRLNILPYSIAASLAILIGAYFFLQTQDTSPDDLDTIQYVSEELRQETQELSKSLILPDSTVVNLNPYSSIEYSVSLDKESSRQVKLLSGSADFDVTHDADRKFKVFCDGIGIEVLGTVFSVNKSNDGVDVNLKSGAISAYKVNDKTSSILMQPGDQLSFKEGKFIKTENSNITDVLPKEEIAPVIEKTIEPVIPVVAKETSKEIKEEGSTYPIGKVLDFIDNSFGKRLKVDKRLGVDLEESIWFHIHEEDLEVMLKKLEEATGLTTRPGKCDDCYIITSPSKKK